MRRWDDHPKGPGLCYPACVDPRDIAHVCQLTEAHEGLAVVRTVDEALGMVEFWVSELNRDDFEAFARALTDEVGVRFAPPRQPRFDSLK